MLGQNVAGHGLTGMKSVRIRADPRPSHAPPAKPGVYPVLSDAAYSCDQQNRFYNFGRQG